MDELTTGQLIDVMGPFLDDGRITGTVYIDGVMVADTDADSAVDPAGVDWDKYGLGPHDEYGCCQVEAVEELRDKWLESGDKFEQEVAALQAQYYGVPIPGRQYTPEQEMLLNQNVQRLWGWGGFGKSKFMFSKFHRFNERFAHKVTLEPKASLTAAERYSKEYTRNPNYVGDSVPNHAGVGRGNWMDPEHPDWENNIAGELAMAIVQKMNEHADRLRRFNPGAPEPSVGG